MSQSIRAEFGIPAQSAEIPGLIESVFPSGDPAERMLLASGGTRSGLLVLADEVLAAFDTVIEIAEGAGDAAVEKRSALESAARSNPLLSDALQTFDKMRPLWDRFRARFASLRSLAESDR